MYIAMPGGIVTWEGGDLARSDLTGRGGMSGPPPPKAEVVLLFPSLGGLLLLLLPVRMPADRRVAVKMDGDVEEEVETRATGEEVGRCAGILPPIAAAAATAAAASERTGVAKTDW